MKILFSFFAGYDVKISFYHADKVQYHTIQIERLVKQRYFRLHEDNDHLYQRTVLEKCRDIAWEEWGIENNYEAVLISSDGYVQTELRGIFNTEKVITIASHHKTHAAYALQL